MINLTPLSTETPIAISEDEYRELTLKNDNGWSNCEKAAEWLAKLHYLRAGRAEGKIGEAEFRRKEETLVLNWWRKWT